MLGEPRPVPYYRDALVVADIGIGVVREVEATWTFDEHRRPETYGALTR